MSVCRTATSMDAVVAIKNGYETTSVLASDSKAFELRWQAYGSRYQTLRVLRLVHRRDTPQTFRFVKKQKRYLGIRQINETSF